MALGIVVQDKRDFDLGQQVVADITFDNSYPTGGEEIKASDLGLRVGSRLDSLRMDAQAGYVFEYVPDGSLKDRGKIKVFRGDYDQGADAPLVEVADTFDLSAVKVRAVASGR